MWVAAKHFLPDMTWLYHFKSYSTSCYLHKIKPQNIPVWKEGDPTPSYGAFGVDGSWRSDSLFFFIFY